MSEKKRKYYRTPVDGLNRMRMEQIGGLLREYRYDTMLSREDFAREYGISRSLVERAERGMSVHFLTYLRLADIFHIPVWQLFEGVE